MGGIFRHIADVVKDQHRRGYEVGLICDSRTGGEFEMQKLEALRPFLSLGAVQLPMARNISPSDISILWKMIGLLDQIDVDVVHCHGAKGGAYGRLIARALSHKRLRRGERKVLAIYSPHGGSLHFDRKSLAGRVYFTLERILERCTDSFVFVSGFEVEAYTKKVGRPFRPWTISYNGLTDEELEPIEHAPNAVDFLYAGHMRDLKGTDLFIDAMEIVNQRFKQPVKALMFGDGEDLDRYKQDVKDRKLERCVEFRPPAPIREVFTQGKSLVVPSRAESMPYIVLEAIGACQPMIATKVGGIPEIFGPYANRLIKAGDANLIATEMIRHLDHRSEVEDFAEGLRRQIRTKFSNEKMCETINDVYRKCLANAAQ